MKDTKNFKSDISQTSFPDSEKVEFQSLRLNIKSIILKDYPNLDEQSIISTSELNFYRQKYLAGFLLKEVGELTDLEETVLDSITNKNIVSDSNAIEAEDTLTFGQRISDKVAAFGGSWTFIISFLVFIFFWIGLNAIWLSQKTFDPFPFILLNLMLSFVAALQAPVIMMSQNRQEDKDRERAKRDYMVNLKSELEIRVLHDKIDHLILHQQKELLSIQKVQLKIMNDLSLKLKNNKDA